MLCTVSDEVCGLAGVGRGVALVPAAAAEAVQDAAADATADATDAGAEEEQDDGSKDDPNPDAGTALSIQTLEKENSKYIILSF